MKKVYQTVVSSIKGNCMQAAVASLFDLELEDVPDFIDLGEEWGTAFMQFFWERGYEPTNIYGDKYSTEKMQEMAEFDGGVNGYFYASVYSPTYGKEVLHAVIVDKDLNVVHDPNPNQKALELSSEDVLDILTVNPIIIGKTGRLFTKEEWDNESEEVRDANTYKTRKENGKLVSYG